MSVDTSIPAFRGEDISTFSSTLVVNPETGAVRTLRTERMSDFLRSGEPVAIEETLRFSEVRSTQVSNLHGVD